MRVGLLRAAATVAGLALVLALAGCGVDLAATTKPAPRPERTAVRHASVVLPWHATAPSSVLPGDVLIADNQNNRILLVTPQKKIVWRYPVPGHRSNLPFRFPDDAFFTPGYGGIITNEEDYGTIAVVSFKDPHVVWEYGTPGHEGDGPGQLNYPDDAIMHSDGIVTAADIRNQRIVFISVKQHRIVKQWGTTGLYASNPPKSFGAPNGDFNAPHGGMLVSEINGLYNYVILLTKTGKVVYQFHIPNITYISDANFTPKGNIIAVDYSNPGQIVIVNPKGKVLWRWDYRSGPKALNQPSLAVQLPNGNILCNDDGDNRVIVINPTTRKIVWQYGHKGVAGTGWDYLNDPDGVDFLPAGVVPGRVPALPKAAR
jgi:outer membrane protein assembly factor BamB